MHACENMQSLFHGDDDGDDVDRGDGDDDDNGDDATVLLMATVLTSLGATTKYYRLGGIKTDIYSSQS